MPSIWLPLLNSAAKGKDLPEKQLIVLGGSSEQQREFLDHLNPKSSNLRYAGNDRRRQIREAPISNQFALGYTYQNILDADQEDVLARLNIYMLSNPSSKLAPLLKTRFTPETVKDTLITILLDWSEPGKWARQLRQWIRLLRSVIIELSEETKIAMEETMTAWKEKRVGPDAPLSSASAEQNATPAVPPGPGEWDEGLGIPLSVVCVRSEKIQNLERDAGWQDDQFDFLMQWLRCVLVKHGASLIYTASYDPNNVRALIHSSLSVYSLLKKETIKHNIIDRDKILIPPNWDSWGKIRILKDSFDIEAVSDAWSVEIQAPPDEHLTFSATPQSTNKPSTTPEDSNPDPSSAVSIYESILPLPPPPSTAKIEPSITAPAVQAFLSTQSTILADLTAADEKADRKGRKGAPADTTDPAPADSRVTMKEAFGPHNININGIDVDAEEATRRLVERESVRRADAAAAANVQSGGAAEAVGPAPTSTTPGTGTGMGTGTGTPVGKQSAEAMSQFFANLIKKDKRGGAAASPTRSGVSTPRE